MVMLWMLVFLAVLMFAISLGSLTSARTGQCLAKSDESVDDEELLDIDDPRVADVVRAHAARFRDPVRNVAICGADIVLLGENGDVIDICALR